MLQGLGNSFPMLYGILFSTVYVSSIKKSVNIGTCVTRCRLEQYLIFWKFRWVSRKETENEAMFCFEHLSRNRAGVSKTIMSELRLYNYVIWEIQVRVIGVMCYTNCVFQFTTESKVASSTQFPHRKITQKRWTYQQHILSIITLDLFDVCGTGS